MNKIEAAKARAGISAYLSNNPGEQTTAAIAEYLGLNPRSTGQILGGMAKGNLIKYVRKQGKHAYWMWDSNAPIIGDNSKPPIKPAPKPPRGDAHPAKEVELEIDGITIVVGRNPTTGRFRVILEG